jgi:hypothetical protein
MKPGSTTRERHRLDSAKFNVEPVFFVASSFFARDHLDDLSRDEIVVPARSGDLSSTLLWVER